MTYTSSNAALPKALRPAFAEVKKLIAENRLNDARAALAKIPQAESFANYHVAMAIAAFKEEACDLALAHMKKAIELNNENPKYYIKTAALSLKVDNNARPTDLIDKALSCKHIKSNDVIHAARLLQKMDNSDLALSILQDGVVKRPNDPSIRLALSRQLLSMKQYVIAKKELEFALTLNPQSFDARIVLSKMYIAIKTYREAKAVLEPIIAFDTYSKVHKEKASLHIADALIRLDDHDAASRILADSSVTTSPLYNFLWGKIHQHAGRVQDAYNSFVVAYATLYKDTSIAKENSNQLDDYTLNEECNRLKSLLEVKLYSFTDGPSVDEFLNIAEDD